MASARRHVAPKVQEYGAEIVIENEETLGICIQGWEIRTGQGSIANESSLHHCTELCQEMSQYAKQKNTQQRQRRLCLPEMVFMDAHISLKKKKKSQNTSTTTTNNNDIFYLRLDATSALTEWAQAHQEIELEDPGEFRGVSVLKSLDAEQWLSKKPLTNNASLFHYDWSFSTPYVGGDGDSGISISSSNRHDANVVGESLSSPSSNSPDGWQSLSESGMPMHLLQDRSVPILYFDQLVLYEDDMHDNGQVSLTAKVRVMPTCAFILIRLWVRIDGVLLRVRETRIMVEFESSKIYRDVAWKECKWKDLDSHNLPTDVRAWRHDGVVESAGWHSLLSRLPHITLPPNLDAHSVISILETDESADHSDP